GVLGSLCGPRYGATASTTRTTTTATTGDVRRSAESAWIIRRESTATSPADASTASTVYRRLPLLRGPAPMTRHFDERTQKKEGGLHGPLLASRGDESGSERSRLRPRERALRGAPAAANARLEVGPAAGPVGSC